MPMPRVVIGIGTDVWISDMATAARRFVVGAEFELQTFVTELMIVSRK